MSRLLTESGLTSEQARNRLQRHGPNTVPASPPERLWRKVGRAVRDPLVLVLLAAATLTLITADFTDAVVIGLVVIVNTTVAVRQEVGAERALAALRSMATPHARVIRDGAEQALPVEQIVPGDLVVIAEGDLVPADGRIVEAAALRLNEATLTGESVPVDKSVAVDERDTTAETHLLSGTAVVHGRGRMTVERTGRDSAVGQIAALLEAGRSATPLQRRMAKLSVVLATSALVLCGIVLVEGLVRGQSLELMLLAAASLAVAAVPESLPAVVTISLSLAARRMARRHAVVRNLAAVETLGSVTLLATDKTGTLTQARMSVTDEWVPEGVQRADLQRALILCNDASDIEHAGDPTESALLAGLSAEQVQSTRTTYPRLDELPFDSDRKRMTTMHARPDGGTLTICKGAPEPVLTQSVLDCPDEIVQQALHRAEAMSAKGLRVLAVAERRDGAPPKGPVESGLRLLGLVGLQDPPRASAAATLRACREAGIRVTLVTGDHALTAAGIATQVGVGGSQPTVLDLARTRLGSSPELDVDVIARARPADKVDAVRRWQHQGHVVAMTGDGVNDGPALQRADIGVAMGQRGSEVARQAADLVLRDDELGTLVAAVEEGRRVHDNIRRFLLYGLSGGVAEILVMLVGPVVGVPLPLLPGQILWVNLVTHSLTGTALGSEPVQPGSMSRPPTDPAQGILGGGLWWRILVLALVVAGAGGAAAALAADGAGRPTLMLALSSAMLGVAWGTRVRPETRSLPRIGKVANPALLGAIALSVLLLLGAVVLPVLQRLLETSYPGTRGLIAAAAAAVVGLVATRSLGHRGPARSARGGAESPYRPT
jgi:Ca2+-transporting ATPase